MSKRGFAAMDPEKVRSIASAGGRAAHAAGTAHKWTAEEASIAGRKGGAAARRRGAERQPELPYTDAEGPVTQRAPQATGT